MILIYFVCEVKMNLDVNISMIEAMVQRWWSYQGKKKYYKTVYLI